MSYNELNSTPQQRIIRFQMSEELYLGNVALDLDGKWAFFVEGAASIKS
jgi:hypothetical protein